MFVTLLQVAREMFVTGLINERKGNKDVHLFVKVTVFLKICGKYPIH